MPQSKDPEGLTGDGARAAVRLGADYLLRSLQMLGELSDGHMLSGLISLAIVQANTSHLEGSGAYRDVSDLPPDNVRRPVSVLAIANSLGLPYETTRRHIDKMIQSGQVSRVNGGIIVPAAALNTPRHAELLTAHLTNLRRLVRGLAAAGLDLS
mgnify:CR=1 FL=1